MKLLNVITLGLAAAAGAVCAQQQAAPVQVKAYVMFAGKQPQSILLSKANGKNQFIYVSQEQEMQGDASKCKMFFIQTPKDLADAEKAYRSRELASARKQLAAVKAKYLPWVGLPDNPSARAAVLELECAARQMDWEGLRSLLASFPHPDWLSPEDQALVEAARVLSRVSDDPSSLATQKAAVENVAKAKEKTLNSRTYGWLMYALGRAYAAQIPADQKQGSISADQVQNANLAIDTLCQAAMSSHGAQMEIPVDAMRRAQSLLWAMPGVKEYAGRMGKMDQKKWNEAPADFRDAVALAYLIKNVYSPNSQQDAVLDKAASFFFNTKEEPKD